MRSRRRHARYPSPSAAAGSDTDALQTDVMRFMSIIGLCLMVLFPWMLNLMISYTVNLFSNIPAYFS